MNLLENFIDIMFYYGYSLAWHKVAQGRAIGNPTNLGL